MEIWLEWPSGIKCWQTTLQGNVFYCVPLRQHVWFYYFKNKISEAKLLKSRTGLKDGILNHGKICNHCEISLFTLTSRNLHWRYSLWRGWSELPIPPCIAQARNSSSWLSPVYIQHLCNPDGEKHMWRHVCVIWSSRWVRMTNCCLCRHLPRDYSESCLCVLLFCSYAALSNRALSGIPRLKLYLTWQRSCAGIQISVPFSTYVRSWCAFPSKEALTVLKIVEGEKQGGTDFIFELLHKDRSRFSVFLFPVTFYLSGLSLFCSCSECVLHKEKSDGKWSPLRAERSVFLLQSLHL